MNDPRLSPRLRPSDPQNATQRIICYGLEVMGPTLHNGDAVIVYDLEYILRC